MQSEHDNPQPFALPAYFLDTFADSATRDTTRAPDLSVDDVQSSRHLARFGPFPTLPQALDKSEALAREALDVRDTDAPTLARVEVRAAYPDRSGDSPAFVGIVDALERVRLSQSFADRFRWRMDTREEVRREEPAERMERTRDAAESFLRREYFDDVRGYAADILRAVADGEITDREGFEERLHETCDGSARVIYTSQALDVLRWTESDDAGFDEMGSDFLDGCSSMAEVYTRAAFYALRADVADRVRGFDVSDLDTFQARTLADFDVDDDDTYPAKRADDADGTADEIREGFAKCAHALAWADCAERYGLSNLSGCEILDVCSPTSPEAEAYAARVFDEIEARERKRAGSAYSLAADFLARIQPEAEEHTRTSSRGIPTSRTTAEHFGHALALEHFGHGAGWADDKPEHGIEPGHGEYSASFRGEDFGLDDDEMRQRAEDADDDTTDRGQSEADGTYTLPGHA